MEYEGEEQEGNSLPELIAKNARDRKKHECGGHVARMQVLVGDVDGCSGDRQSEHRCDEGDSGPLDALIVEKNPDDATASCEDHDD